MKATREYAPCQICEHSPCTDSEIAKTLAKQLGGAIFAIQCSGCKIVGGAGDTLEQALLHWDISNRPNVIVQALIQKQNTAMATAVNDKRGLQHQIYLLLHRLDRLEPGMHTRGMTPDWYVEAAYWSAYGESPKREKRRAKHENSN